MTNTRARRRIGRGCRFSANSVWIARHLLTPLLFWIKTMSEQVAPSSVVQRIIIKFLSIEGVRPSEIMTRFQAYFGDETLSKTQLYEWHKRFLAERERVQNVFAVIEPPPRKRSSVQYVSFWSVTVAVHLKKLLDQWGAVMGVCQRLLSRYEDEGKGLLNRIVTYDETRVHHYTPESKQASMEWRKKGERALVKAKTRLSAGKVLSTVFWDRKYILFVDLSKTKTAYRAKRRSFPIRNAVLLYDNARPHTAAITQAKLS
ncbi:hypothetical protein NQ318_001241 [Aromia moschata]|uniref:Transposase n=1 Tax=Aromia moschata TaxID=1265417 RepID=A0AAV8ZHI6_9CUCU|nr:hypothetical protein NQ318_001241 [Aromia moschata]